MATTAPEALFQTYNVAETVDYIITGGYRSVALQFPDDQLADSPAVSRLLQEQLGDRARVFILADTAYNPLGVDEVAAQHLAANCVIHYGRASLVPVHSLPAFFVLPKLPLDVPATAAAVRHAVTAAVQARSTKAGAKSASNAGGSPDGCGGVYRFVVLLLDQGYQHRLGELRAALRAEGQGGTDGGAATSRTASSSPPAGAPRPPTWVFARVIARSLAPPARGAAARPPPQPLGGGMPRAAGSGSGPGKGTREAESSSGNSGGRSCCHAAAGCAGTAPSPPPQAADPSLDPGALQLPSCCLVAQQPYGACEAGSPAACHQVPPGDCLQQPTTATVAPSSPAAAAAAAAAPAVAAAAPPSDAQAGPRAWVEETWVEETWTSGGRGGGSGGGSGSGGQEGPGAGAGDDPGGDDTTGDVTRMAGLQWSLPPGANRQDCLYVWVGPAGSSAQQVLQMTHSTCDWLSYDPSEAAVEGGAGMAQGLSDETRRLLKRRNFVVEKARAANIVGLLVGTLGSEGFRDVISALRRMAAAAGKKCYTFLMGKPNPAKLGNFPEVDVFVMVSDAQGLIMDCRDYLAPLVTPWEAALALSAAHIDPEDYRLEMRDVLDFERVHQARLAELAKQQQQQQQDGGDDDATDSALAVLGAGLTLATRGSGAGAGGGGEVVARSAAEYLALKRTWRGLEMPATGASPKEAELAVEGRSGRAAVYEDERS